MRYSNDISLLFQFCKKSTTCKSHIEFCLLEEPFAATRGSTAYAPITLNLYICKAAASHLQWNLQRNKTCKSAKKKQFMKE